MGRFQKRPFFKNEKQSFLKERYFFQNDRFVFCFFFVVFKRDDRFSKNWKRSIPKDQDTIYKIQMQLKNKNIYGYNIKDTTYKTTRRMIRCKGYKITDTGKRIKIPSYWTKGTKNFESRQVA